MNINELTIGQAKELAQFFNQGGSAEQAPFDIGQGYLIRTVTNYWTGRVEAIQGGFLKLSTAAWIADTGRFNEAVRSGNFSEVEPVGDALVSLGSIVDAAPIWFELPTEVR